MTSHPVSTTDHNSVPPSSHGSSSNGHQEASASSSSSSSSMRNACNGSSTSAAEGEALGTSTAAPASNGVDSNSKLQQLLDSLRSLIAACNQPRVWALTVFVIAYVHQATTGFALPAMLPMISSEMGFSDMQGALLTTGYSYLYALALVPLGMVADKMSRPKLLAVGLFLWSGLTITASYAMDYTQLITARVGFAAAQATQNPICFSLIQELFPRSKSTALAIYNCGIYVGRALSFCAVLAARHLSDATRAAQHTAASFANSSSGHSLARVVESGEALTSESSWRTVLRWTAVPGFVLAAAVWFTLKEPREEAESQLRREAEQSRLDPARATPGATPLSAASNPNSSASLESRSAGSSSGDGASVSPGSNGVLAAAAATAAAIAVPVAIASGVAASHPGSTTVSDLLALLTNPAFMATTLAAAMNDIGCYALIAWQSTFYERVYGLTPGVYAPVMAMLLPIGGIIGGVGGGYLADILSRTGGRVWVTAGASLAAAPFFAHSFLAAEHTHSFLAILIGFALSEAWRAPSAVMARSIAPERMGATSSALYLCIRNLVGGLGPLGVAWLMAAGLPLRQAMLLIPASYLLSSLLFVVADRLYRLEMAGRGPAAPAPAPAPAPEAAGDGFQTVAATA
ncbi:MAG: hypothetical protein WDW36_001514 [Sanguina aurantia]